MAIIERTVRRIHMNRGCDAMRGLQGPDPMTAHTCSVGSDRICHGMLADLEQLYRQMYRFDDILEGLAL